MSIHGVVLQHQSDSPAALLADWGEARGIPMTVVRVDQESELPDPAAFDFAVSLGSDCSADDDVPWVGRELEWLRRADAQVVPTLGICFGGQALAVALGGGVARAPEPEIGWVALDTRDPALVEPGPWLAWHNDVIDLPPEAVEIARSRACVHAFTVGPHLGLQFHPEVTAELVGEWSGSPGGVRALASVVVDVDALVAESEQRAGPARTAAFRLFDAFLARARQSDNFDRITLTR